MTSSIKLTAVLLVLTTALFSSIQTKAATTDDGVATITVQALRTGLGFGISILNTDNTKATVKITDTQHNVLLLDKLRKKASAQKAYNLSQLDNGDYAVTIKANDQTLTKQLRVYDEFGKKAYVFLQ